MKNVNIAEIAKQLQVTKSQADWAYQEVTRRAKNIPEYQLLTKKRYRTPKGYQDYQNVAIALARHCYMFREFPQGLDEKEKFAETMAAVMSIFLAQKNAPIYWIAKDLLTAILKTDLPPHVTSMNRVIERGIFMLPLGVLKTPDGETVDHLCFHHVCAGDAVPVLKSGKHSFLMGPTDINKMTSFTTTNGGTCYASTTSLEMEDGKLIAGDWTPSPSVAHQTTPKEVEQSFLLQMDQVIIQTLLYMQVKPESLELGNMVGFGGQAVRRSDHDTPRSNNLLNPNWIGKEYRLPCLRATPTGTHASPETHWRRGFWRNQPVGEGRSDRKWVWIQPTLVNG